MPAVGPDRVAHQAVGESEIACPEYSYGRSARSRHMPSRLAELVCRILIHSDSLTITVLVYVKRRVLS